MAKTDLTIVQKTAEEILEKVISPVCNVPEGITANFFTAKFSDYDKGDPAKRQRILKDILEKYGVEPNGLEAIQDYPLALISLYILDKEQNES